MNTINETLNSLPPEARQVVIDFVEFIAQKYLKKKYHTNHSKEKILNYAGAWRDMNKNDFQSLINDVYERRERAFKRRWKA